MVKLAFAFGGAFPLLVTRFWYGKSLIDAKPPGFISPGALLFTVLPLKLLKPLSKNNWL